MKSKFMVMTMTSVLLASMAGCTTTEISKIESDLNKATAAVNKATQDTKNVLAALQVVEAPLPPIPVNYEWSYNQSWKLDQSEWFWHFPQGTYLIPYSWFVSLEQPIGSNMGLTTGSKLAKFMLAPSAAAEDVDNEIKTEEKNDDKDWASTGDVKDKNKSKLFINDNYLAGFGMIPVKNPSPDNPDALPLGITKFNNFVNPQKKAAKKEVVMGMGCALCHSNRIDYKGKSMLVDGGPSQANLTLFVQKMGVSLVETYLLPTRFARFADRVYGHKASKEEQQALKDEVKAFITANVAQLNAPSGSTASGFGRLDALTAIGNTVFGKADLNAPENALPSDAPVSYPMIWTVPWFQWAEYPGVVEQPMVRNVGEALGVNAPVNLTSDDPADLFKSTVQVDELYRAETLLMEGIYVEEITKPTPDPYKYIDLHKQLPGLTAPKWPEEMLGVIDQAKAKKGAKLYAELCQGCHLPALSSPELYARDSSGNLNLKYWTKKNKWGKQYLNVVNIGVEKIGTDNTEMMNFYKRTAVTANLTVQGTPLEPLSAATQNGVKKLGTYLSAADGLKVVTAAVADKWYAENGITDQNTIDMLNGYRDNVVNMTPPTYRARPLDGIWATPSYLHNGSVPNLYQLLSPVSERATRFVTGKKEFDPVSVGYETCYDEACIKENLKLGYTVFSVKDALGNPITGNSNAGHEFNGDGKTNTGDGVIGRLLAPEERWDLVEYLKTL